MDPIATAIAFYLLGVGAMGTFLMVGSVCNPTARERFVQLPLWAGMLAILFISLLWPAAMTVVLMRKE